MEKQKWMNKPTRWINLKNVMLSKGIQAQKNTYIYVEGIYDRHN